MQTLADSLFSNLDISTEKELISFTITGQHAALIIMINVDGLAGVGGEYSAKVYIDNHLVVPDRTVIVASGMASISFQSRDIVLYKNGILKVLLKGLSGDVNVHGRMIIIDTSPVTVEEVSDLINSITPNILDSITLAIGNLNVSVRPEVKILGPCQKPVTPIPMFKRFN